MNRLQRLILTLIALALTGCASAPLKSEYTWLGYDLTARSDKPDHSKVLLFNSSNRFLYPTDLTARINIWIDGKAVGTCSIGEYVQVLVPKGERTLRLMHWDLVEFSSEHPLSLKGDETIVEVWATPVSNAMRVLPELPPRHALPSSFRPCVPR